MRVVGGIATHSEGATIRTPVAAIGLRGGIAIISHSGAKGTQAILGFGHMTVTSLCAGINCTPTTTEVSRPGFGVTVTGFSQPPSSAGRTSSEQIARAWVEIAKRATGTMTFLERSVNGQPGLVAQQDGVTVTVFAFEVAGDRIKHIWVVRNPEKLRRWTTG